MQQPSHQQPAVAAEQVEPSQNGAGPGQTDTAAPSQKRAESGQTDTAALAEVQAHLRRYDARLVLARVRGTSLWQEQVILHSKVFTLPIATTAAALRQHAQSYIYMCMWLSQVHTCNMSDSKDIAVKVS